MFKIVVEQKRLALDGGEVSLVSKFNLVDLAGEKHLLCCITSYCIVFTFIYRTGRCNQ